MVKVAHSVATRKRKKKLLKSVKGFWGDRSKQFQQARRALAHALVYNYRDRKVAKREFRQIWIARINAACRAEGLTYNRFMGALKKANILLDRKTISELAIKEPVVMSKLLAIAKQ